MATISPWKRSREMFADQFEPDGEAYLYRRSLKGAPVRASAAERQKFIEQFSRRQRYTNWGIPIGFMVIVVLTALWAGMTRSEVGEIPTYVAVFVFVGGAVAYVRWSWTAPARELRDRPVLGRPRTRREATRLWLGKMGYGYLLMLGGIVVLISLHRASEDGWSTEWGHAWLGFGAAALIIFGFRAYQKWRFERDELSGAD